MLNLRRGLALFQFVRWREGLGGSGFARHIRIHCSRCGSCAPRFAAPFNTLAEQFRTELAQELGGRVDFHDLALETRPSENPALDRAFIQYLTALFVERPPDLIVPIGGAAVRFLQRHREEAARGFGQKLIQAQEEERARLAKELHDGLSQNLARLAVELELFGQKPPGLPALVTQRMQDFSAQTKDLSSEVHRLSHALHPAKLHQLGLAAAIGGFCREVEAAELLSIKFEAHNVPRMMPQDISLCLYRVAQEALQNVAKHSGARSAAVELSYEDGQVVMSIADDGRGFDTQANTNGGSLGLVGMRERVHLVRGEIAVESGPDRGTRVRVRVPSPRGDSG